MTDQDTPKPTDETPETQDAPNKEQPAEETPTAETPADVPAEKSETKESKPATKAAKATKATKPAKVAKTAKAEKPAATAAAKTGKIPKAPIAPSGNTPPDGHWWWGTGRRKTAVARVRIRPGTGKFIVNKKPYDEYFNEERDRNDMMNVLQKTSTEGGVDIYVKVHGGGFMGQAGAIVLGIARALRKYDETLEPILRSNQFLSRDPRKVERKKYGQRGARRKFQFSKR